MGWLEDQEKALLGMAEENWILHTMVIDKTQFRIPLALMFLEKWVIMHPIIICRANNK